MALPWEDNEMITRKVTTCLMLLALLPLALPLHAASRIYLGVQAGPEFVTDSDSDLDTAFAFGVYGGYRVDRMLSIEASLTTADHDFNGHGGSDVEVTSILLGPRLNAYMNGGTRLYAGAGFGLHFIDFDHRPGDDTETSGGIYMGGGIEVPLRKTMNLGIDLKYHVPFDDDLDSDLVTLLFRLGFDL